MSQRYREALVVAAAAVLNGTVLAPSSANSWPWLRGSTSKAPGKST